MVQTIDVDAVPGPKGLPYLGNLLDIDRDSPIEGFMRMAREYGPIFRLSTPAGVRLMISDPVMVDEVCDDERYDKKIAAGLKSIQSSVAGGGLFSSDTENPLWHRAHTILMPPFSGQAMRDYMPKMLDLADQLMDKWSRLNPDEDVDVDPLATRVRRAAALIEYCRDRVLAARQAVDEATDDLDGD